jgi:hypothetical protein
VHVYGLVFPYGLSDIHDNLSHMVEGHDLVIDEGSPLPLT